MLEEEVWRLEILQPKDRLTLLRSEVAPLMAPAMLPILLWLLSVLEDMLNLVVERGEECQRFDRQVIKGWFFVR